MSDDEKRASVESVLAYHERTKHHGRRYALGPVSMDWASEPRPFRRWTGAEIVRLPLTVKDPHHPYNVIFDRGLVPASGVTPETVSKFLELSLAISSWKAAGESKWALRVNPSSGNLHPIEAYLFLPPAAAPTDGGVYHYNPLHHGLVERALVPGDLWQQIDDQMGSSGFFVALTSVVWREAWKYGERAFRYTSLDMGHAAACLSFSTSLQGWRATQINGVSDRDMETMLGFDRIEWAECERERGEALIYIHPARGDDVPATLPASVVSSFAGLDFKGTPNRLSDDHTEWPVIDEVCHVTRATGATASSLSKSPGPGSLTVRPFFECPVGVVGDGAAGIIKKRRSGRDYDGTTRITRDAFISILDRTVPRPSHAPFDISGDISGDLSGFVLPPYLPEINLLLFVHRVIGLTSGLYLLVRRESDLPELKDKFSGDFLWTGVTAAEGGDTDPFGLYLLQEGDVSAISANISCNQVMAGDGVFSVSMLARFRENIESDPHSYRRLFWEAGIGWADTIPRSDEAWDLGHRHRLLLRRHGPRATRFDGRHLPVPL